MTMPQKRSIDAERRRKFTNVRSRAKGRGIPWRLTYEQWCAIWDGSAHFPERGVRRGEYQMDRIDNAGAYELGNVQIVLGAVNRTKDTPHGARPKLTEQAVKDIRRAFIDGLGYGSKRPQFNAMAQYYGVRPITIQAVVYGRNWKSA